MLSMAAKFLGGLLMNSPLGIFINKHLITIVLIGVVALGGFFTYKYISNKFIELDTMKLVVQSQQTTINSLKDELEKTKASYKATESTLVELKQTQQDLLTIANKKAANVSKKVSDVNKDKTLSEKQKLDKKSEIFILDLTETFCLDNTADCEALK